MPDEEIRKSKLLSEGTTTHPKDSEGNIPPADREITFTIPKDATEKHPSVSEGIIGDKDSGGMRPPTDMEPKPTPEGSQYSGTDSKDQADKTQSSGLEGSGPG